MKEQIIVALSREFGSGGHEIGEKIARDLGIGFYDRNMLDEIAKEKGVKTEDLEKYDEKPRKHIFSRTVQGHTNSNEEIIAQMQFDYLRRKADTGESFVVVGRCAETVLKDREGLLSIFVWGDREKKLDRVMRKYQLNEADAEAKMIRHDKTRKHYHNHHSETRWGHARSYDVCVNSSLLGTERTAEILEEYIKDWWNQ
jgi:cytidylate kinase